MMADDIARLSENSFALCEFQVFLRLWITRCVLFRGRGADCELEMRGMEAGTDRSLLGKFREYNRNQLKRTETNKLHQSFMMS